MKGKKAEATEGILMQIGKTLLFVIFLTIIISLIVNACELTKKEGVALKQTEETIEKLQETNAEMQITQTITLEPESAIIAMNPGKNFFYITEETVPRGRYFKRPLQCPDEKICVCECQGIKLNELTQKEALDLKNYYNEGTRFYSSLLNPGQKITCDNIQCKSIENIKIKEKILMNEVFEDNKESIIRSEKSYWLDSFIIIRSTLLPKGETINLDTKYLDFGGYMTFSPGSRLEVTFKKDKENQISICIEDCE